ncbi:MAG: outer membrane protein assembly factor BamB family protein [Planctomycetota bacterium]|jgi:hypothetical protein
MFARVFFGLAFFAAPTLAAPDRASYPAIVGEAVGPSRHAYWPVRVRRLDRIVWRWAEGSRAGFAAPIADGLLFIQAGGGGIRGVEAGNGHRSWHEPGNMRYWNYSSCVLGQGGVAYGGNFNWVRAVDRQGKRLWATHLQCAWIHAPPAVSPDGKTVYLGGDRLGIASLNAANGHVNWMRRDFHSPGTRYVFDEAGNVIAAHGRATVCYAGNGRELWRIDQPLREPMRVGDLLLAVASDQLRAYRLSDRSLAWTFVPGCGITGLALRDDHRVVVSLASGQLAILAPRDGSLLQRAGVSDVTLRRPVTVLGGETVVADVQGTLYLIDANLRVISQLATGKKPYGWRPTVTRDGHVLLNHADTVLCIGGEPRPDPDRLVATELTVVADDFVVDVWHNGRKLPDGARKRVVETFGAMMERIHVTVREGDWLVFHVVANRFRWNGSAYFGLAARGPGGNEALVSSPDGPWSYCDEPARVA